MPRIRKTKEKLTTNKTLEDYMQGEEKATIDTLRILTSKDNFDEIVSSLKAAFQRDLNVEEACLEAGISRETYYNWIKASYAFANQIEKARQRLKVHTKKLIAEKILNQNDFEAAKWWAERKLKSEFSTRTEHTGENGNSLKIIIEKNIIDGNKDSES
jgi:predicted DNA-binding protein (UPF0251 family)